MSEFITVEDRGFVRLIGLNRPDKRNAVNGDLAAAVDWLVKHTEADPEIRVVIPTVRGVSYNLHTPYPGTEDLTLRPDQRRDVCDRIAQLIRQGYPVLNLASALPYLADQSGPGPCPQCVIVEDGQQWTCGRCIEIPGLCEQCGFSFATELSLLFRGHPRVVAEVLRRYPSFLKSTSG